MSKHDYLSLDARALKVLLTVLEEGSVSAAAERLGVSQSAVSHALEKLRAILGDPLFVKAGRGIRPTAHAEALGARIGPLLDEMKSLTVTPDFEPAGARLEFVIAANDLQRDLLLPELFRRLRAQAAEVRLSVVGSAAPAELLRSDRCDLVVTPQPPDAADIIQKRLLSDRYVCFYDAAVRPPPASLDDYLQARHATLLFASGERTNVDRALEEQGLHRDIALTVPNFSGIPPFLRGSDLLATLPSLLRLRALSGLDWAPAPLLLPELPVYMVWHQRSHLDPAQRWLREVLESVAADMVDALPGR